MTTIFGLTVLLSAFLLFAVQPLLAKALLPGFGGGAAVWGTCLVLFQTLLLGGYAYAHLLRTKLPPFAQRGVHLGVLVVALWFLPVKIGLPAAINPAHPTLPLLQVLLTTIGVPFLALSATAPLLMEWFRQACPSRPAHRLYAFSNVGSLAALLSYPMLVEPKVDLPGQARFWSWGLGLFVGLCAVVAWISRAATASSASPAPGELRVTSSARVRSPVWLWIALPACGSGLLLALTNQISQDVAAMPLLWVAPMAVYLFTFILCFESSRWYHRKLLIPACLGAFLLLAWMLHNAFRRSFSFQLGGYLAVLLVGCMVCHGELYRLRPGPERLTAFYLSLSLGGALGGLFVAIAAPALFDTLVETPLLAVALGGLLTWLLWSEAPRGMPTRTSASKRAGLAVLVGTVAALAAFVWVRWEQSRESIHVARSFYGAYRVKEGPTLWLDRVRHPLTPGPARLLLSGQTYHGLQFTEPLAARMATTYYCEEGGLGLALREMPAVTNRHLGVLGLGTGTIAAYGRPGDRLRFYEISPEVIRLARSHFRFLADTPAQTEIILGDGRLSLAREADQQFDLLVIDAFTGDAIPTHLLTLEAAQTYRRHLRPDGVLAIHISNNHLNLEPVVRALADELGWQAVLVPPVPVPPTSGKLASIWMLLSGSAQFLNRPAVATLASAPASPSSDRRLLWTDARSSLLPVLR